MDASDNAHTIESKISYQSMLSKAISATLAAMPLSIAVIPWGILCGTLSIEAGLTSIQAQMMSLCVFAGAAQLAGVTIFGAGGGWSSLINSTTMISVRHLLYSATYKDNIAPLPLWKRIIFAFLLTDEMFAVAQVEQAKTGKFDYWYAIFAGFSFYIIWNMATFVGIFSAHLLKNIDEMGFDFAIVATFIAMVVPMVKAEMQKPHPSNKTSLLVHPVFIAVMISAVMALLFAMIGFGQGLIVATLMGMAIGAYLNRHHAKHLIHTTEHVTIDVLNDNGIDNNSIDNNSDSDNPNQKEGT